MGAPSRGPCHGLARRGNGRSDRAGPSFIPVLLEIITGKTQWGHPFPYQARRGAVIAIGRMNHVAALPLLIDFLDDTDPAIRLEAASGPAFLGSHARDACGRLAHVLLHDDVAVALQAAWALGQIGVPAATATLIQASESTDQRKPWLRVAVAMALGQSEDPRRAGPTRP